MLHRLFDNPILVKHVRSRLRRQRIVPTGIALLLICICIFWSAVVSDGLDDGWPFAAFVLLQGAILMLLGTSQVSIAVGRASESGILDFHRASPLPAADQALGFLLGAPIREHLLCWSVTPFTLASAIFGKPGLAGCLVVLGILLTSSLLFHALAMVSGLIAKKTRQASGGVAILVIVSLLASQLVYLGVSLPGLLTPAPALGEVMFGAFPDSRPGDAVVPTFFGLALPLAVQSLIYQAPLFAFGFIAAVRRLRSERAAIYSRPVAALFLAVLAALAMGGLSGHPKVEAEAALPVVLYILVVSAMFLVLATTPDSRGYQNGTRRAAKLGWPRLPFHHDLASNHAAVATFAAIVALAGLCTWQLIPPVDRVPVATAAMQVASAALAVCWFGLGLQLFVLTFRARVMPYFMLFLFVTWVLPLMVGGLLGQTFGSSVAKAVITASPVVGIGAPTPTGLAVGGLVVACLTALVFVKQRELEARLRSAPA